MTNFETDREYDERRAQEIWDDNVALRAENERLEELTTALIARISNPEINLFMEGVVIEAAHQVERWGAEHDASKTFEHWTALLTRLLGKFVDANWSHDGDKALHHLITIAAVCANAHKQMIQQRAQQAAMASHIASVAEQRVTDS